MPDVSEWNERERDAATEALIAYVHNWRLQGRTAQIDREAPSCVDAMLSAVDAVRREPTEPVNTIKFNPKTGDVARCMSHNGGSLLGATDPDATTPAGRGRASEHRGVGDDPPSGKDCLDLQAGTP